MEGCWGSFWGPCRPLFGNHSLLEGGGSYWAPAWVLVLTRFGSSAILVVAVVMNIINYLHFMRLSSIYLWSSALLSVSMALLMITSVLLSASRNGDSSSLLASISIPLMQISATTVLFSFGSRLYECWFHRAPFWPIFLGMLGLPLVCFELVLGTRLVARLSYMFLSLVAFALYFVVFVVVVYARGLNWNPRYMPPIWYVGNAAGAVGASIIVLFAYRVIAAAGRCCVGQDPESGSGSRPEKNDQA